jgi:branched-chain amino acid aminotransferase
MRGDVYVRPIVFANSNELSPILDPETSATAIFCLPLGRYLSAEPIDVCVSSWWRIREAALPARAKATGGYLNSALARREAIDNGYTEAILLTEDGHVTRQSLITLAMEDLGIPFVERPIGRTELYIADEVFLCGTGAEVTAVRSVDRRAVGTGGVGAITQRLSDYFNDVVRGRVRTRADWLTPVW